MTQSKVRDFTDLIAWQKAHHLVLFSYKLTKKFPEHERFGLTNQVTRAAVSITSNIAEGFGRDTRKDKSHYYVMTNEVRSQILVAQDLSYITKEECSDFDKNAVEVLRLISGIIKAAQDH